MDEFAKRDVNYITVMLGVTDDADKNLTQIRLDPVTKRLLIDNDALPAGTAVIGKVGLVDLSGNEIDWADITNNAIRVNVVAGGAGGGVAQTQVRNATNVWTDVGYYTGNLTMPVSDAGGSLTVDGTFWQATQPISAASLPLPTGAATETTLSALNTKVTACDTGAVTISAALPTGTNNIGDVDVLTLPSTVLAGGNLVHIDYDTDVGVQNIPMVGFALPAAGGSISGGTSTSPIRIDPTGTTTQPVSGTFWQATQPISAVSLPLPTGAATSTLQGGGLPAALGAGGGLKIDGSGTALPITGTITAVTSITNALPAGTNTIGNVKILENILGFQFLAAEPTALTVDTPNLYARVDSVKRLLVNLATSLPTGTNNIGDVDVLTLPSLPAGVNNIGDVDVLTLPSLPAGANNIGDVDVLTLPSLPAGANNIGDVDVLTLPSIPAGANNIGDVDVLTLPSIPAGTNLIGQISASEETSTIYSGTTALVPKFAAIDVATLGDNTIVAAVVGKKIRVLQYALVCGAATTVIWYSGAVGTAISGDMSFAANGGISAPYSPVGLFETAAGIALVLNLSAANAVSGHLIYVEV